MKTILVIEDEPDIRDSLQDLLELEGFQAITAQNGTTGIELAYHHRPDLILCDIQMPDIDGYAVLSNLRQNPETATIPFIFLTAHQTWLNMRQGMNLGADDYLVKPYSPRDLMRAIACRLNKHDTAQSQSRRELDNLRSSITLSLPHELRTPLNGILGFSELLLQSGDTMERTEILDIAETIHGSALRLYRLVQNFLLYAQLELLARTPDPYDVLQAEITPSTKPFIQSMAEHMAAQAERSADLTLSLQDAAVRISDFRLKKALEELLDNAFKFSTAGTPVTLISRVEGDRLILELTNQGRGMTPDQINQLGAYMQFNRQLDEQQGTGLGLTIAKRLVELHGGTLTIRSLPQQFTTICISLPLAE